MRKVITVAFLTVLCISVPAISATAPQDKIVSASDLNAVCKGEQSKVCSAYIAGYTQGFYYASVEAKAGFPACIPHGVGDTQARQIVTSFMAQHPEMGQQGAPSVVAEALLVAFPCANPR